MSILQDTFFEKYGLTNVRIKYYLKSAELNIATYDIYGKDPRRTRSEYRSELPKDPKRSLQSAKARARRAVTDIALCNPFTHMFTWTLNKELIDRYDVEEVYNKVSVFLRNAVQRQGFLYVCVPERHADGALHLHGLCSLGDMEISRARNIKNGHLVYDKQHRPVYNMTSWSWGFSTCVPLDKDYEKAVGYVCKYITSADNKIFGKWYLSARACQKKPVMKDYPPVRFDDFVDDEKLASGEQYIFEPCQYLSILRERIPYDD